MKVEENNMNYYEDISLLQRDILESIKIIPYYLKDFAYNYLAPTFEFNLHEIY
jgi:hypothetical protein